MDLSADFKLCGSERRKPRQAATIVAALRNSLLIEGSSGRQGTSRAFSDPLTILNLDVCHNVLGIPDFNSTAEAVCLQREHPDRRVLFSG